MTLGTREPSADTHGQPLYHAPIDAETGPATEALFKEARRRRRNRWLLVLAVLTLVIGVAAVQIVSFGGAPPRRPGGVTRSGGGRESSPPVGRFILGGNGIGMAHFGQTETAAIANLDQILGSSRTATPSPSNNCTIDSYLQWPTITAYFDHQRFVGYGTGSLIGGPGYRGIPKVTTAAGLRIGDTLARARQVYGAALRKSLAQGGSWFATTPTGTLGGNLTNEVNERTPEPRIADVTAGSVGCPAASP